MSISFDPLDRLIAKESIRFIGTVGDVLSNATNVYSAILKEFTGREVRSANELVRVVKRHTECTDVVAKHTIEVTCALRLLVSISAGQSSQTKLVLDDHGRAILALTQVAEWSKPQKVRLAYFRPMFEANGDYLLQCMAAFKKDSSRSGAMELFRQNVASLVHAKLDELPIGKTGSRWEAYEASLEARRRAILGIRGDGTADRVGLDEIQRRRKRDERIRLDALRVKQPPYGAKSAPSEPNVDASTKTLEHHFSRCRAWLIDLALLKETERATYELTNDGLRLLAYFQKATGGREPPRIPPSTATLEDCFRLEPEEIKETWGGIIDDAFWEQALLVLSESGRYLPTEIELHQKFQQSFDAVRVSRISEASIAPMRETMFLSWLIEGRPVDSHVLEEAFVGKNSIPRRHANEFGYGRNRQGRIAFLFRKKAI